MAEPITPKEPQLPVWTCDLKPKNKITVGQKLNLRCQGFDELPVDKRYEIVDKKGDPYFLHLLEVAKDEPMLKEFVVTPYRVYEGSLVIHLQDTQSEQNLFQAAVNEIKVESVIVNKSDAKMVPPEGPSLLQYSPVGLIVLALFVLGAIGAVLFKVMRKARFKQDYTFMMNLVNYQNPFIDLNIDLADIERNPKKLENLAPYLERAFKKFFYNLFKKSVFFDKPAKLNYELRKLQVKDHELRAIGIVKNDYEKIQKGEVFDLDAKRDFIQFSKQSLNKLKRYYSETGL